MITITIHERCGMSGILMIHSGILMMIHSGILMIHSPGKVTIEHCEVL